MSDPSGSLRQLSQNTVPLSEVLPQEPALPPNFGFGNAFPTGASAYIGLQFWRQDEGKLYQRVPTAGGPIWKDLTEGVDTSAVTFSLDTDFPADPGLGDIFFHQTQNIVYIRVQIGTDPEFWKSLTSSVTGVSYTAGDTFPATAGPGDVFYNTVEKQSYRWTDAEDDGNFIWKQDFTPDPVQVLRFSAGAIFPQMPRNGDRHFHTAEGLIFRWIEPEGAWIHTVEGDDSIATYRLICGLKGTKDAETTDSNTVVVADDSAIVNLPKDIPTGFSMDILIVRNPLLLTPLADVSLNGQADAVTISEPYKLYHLICYAPDEFAVSS